MGITRELSEMVSRLEMQLTLLREHSVQAFDLGREEYVGEVASKLRILVLPKPRNTALLLAVAERVQLPLVVTLGGPPVQPPPGEPGRGDRIPLEEFFNLSAFHHHVDGELEAVSKRNLILAWCEKLGGAHEDWEDVPRWLLNAVKSPWLQINGAPVIVHELRICAGIALSEGHKLLDHIAGSAEVPGFIGEAMLAAADDPERLKGAAMEAGRFGDFLRRRGNPEGAERLYREALEAFERLDDSEGVAWGLSSVGIALGERGEREEAEVMFRKALKVDEEAVRVGETAHQYGNLGAIARDRGDLQEAETLQRKALELHREMGQLSGVANALGNLGTIHWDRGELDESEEMYREALQMHERLGAHEGMALQYANLGEVMAARKDSDGAREVWATSIQLFRRIGAEHMVREVQGWLDALEG